MRKLLALSLVVLFVGGFAFAGRGGGMGAVKTDLFARGGGDDPNGPGSGDWVGLVVLNTDCEGMLSANVVVKGLSEGTYDVYLKIDRRGFLVGTIDVNAKGKGQVQVSKAVGVAQEMGETVEVQVVVKAGPGGALVGSATKTEDVPLKLPCE